MTTLTTATQHQNKNQFFLITTFHKHESFYIILISFVGPILIQSKEQITIFAISNYDDFAGISTMGAQWIAFEEINANHTLLPNFDIRVEPFNSHSQRQIALVDALNVTNMYRYHSQQTCTYFPLILGCGWSALSTATN
eukprot:592037_1